jgi:hypothetical protein
MALVQDTVREMMAAGKVTPQTGKKLLRATKQEASKQPTTFPPSATPSRPSKRKAVQRDDDDDKYKAEDEDDDENEEPRDEEPATIKKQPKLSKLPDVVQPKRTNIQAQRKAGNRELPAVEETVGKPTVNERTGKRKSSLRGTTNVEVPSKRVRLSTSDEKASKVVKPKGAFGSDVGKARSGLEEQKTELMQVSLAKLDRADE